MSGPVLEVAELAVSFATEHGDVQAVDDVTYRIDHGETFGIVGESGSGKTVSSLAVMGLLPKRATITGSIKFLGEELLGADPEDVRRLRGDRIAMVFQDALTALNPVMTIGFQIGEIISAHHEPSKAELHHRVHELLEIVGIPNVERRAAQYPHEFSGGMRQRAMIAMAIANEPDLLIADEPTTALDVTVQAQVLEVFASIQARTTASVVMITHDLGVIAGVADRVMVMYAGRDVEQGTVDEIFYSPQHPYTRGLLASLPRVDRLAADGRLTRIPGNPPSVILPPGCAFSPRCGYARHGLCDQDPPPRVGLSTDRSVRCVRHDELEPWSSEQAS